MGIDHHQQRHGGDQRQHHGGEGVDHVSHRQGEVPGTGPHEQMFNRRSSTELFEQNGVTDHSSGSNAADQQQRNRFA